MSSYLARLTAFPVRTDRRPRDRRDAVNLVRALMLLMGLAFIAALAAQFLPDRHSAYSADGDSRSLLDTADDLDPLPPLAEAEALPLIGRAGLTTVYLEAWTQGPNHPPATPPPIGV